MKISENSSKFDQISFHGAGTSNRPPTPPPSLWVPCPRLWVPLPPAVGPLPPAVGPLPPAVGPLSPLCRPLSPLCGILAANARTLGAKRPHPHPKKFIKFDLKFNKFGVGV